MHTKNELEGFVLTKNDRGCRCRIVRDGVCFKFYIANNSALDDKWSMLNGVNTREEIIAYVNNTLWIDEFKGEEVVVSDWMDAKP